MSANKNSKSSPRRIAASRANGAASNGPITQQGRERSSRNALLHGLTATKHVLLSTEDSAAFDRLHQDALDHFQPRTAWEFRQTRLLADFEWTLRRAMGLESAAIETALVGAESSYKQAYRNAPDRSSLFRMWHAIRDQLAYTPAYPILHRYLHSIGIQYHAAYRRLSDSLAQPLQTEVSENGTRFVSQGGDSGDQLQPLQKDDQPIAA